MTTESALFDLVKGLVSNRVYPDVAPQGTTRPYITYQQIGGRPVAFLESSLPSKRNGRFQVNVWADTRLAAAALALQVEAALVAATSMQISVLTEPVSDYEEDTGLFGTRQDFSVWSNR